MGRWHFLLAGLTLVFACGQRPLGTQGGPRPSGIPAEPPDLVVVADAASEDAHVSKYSEPVLAAPELEAVRLALEARDDELAAVTLSDILGRTGPKEPEHSRWFYLLGVIERRRGERLRAKDAFREALAATGPLREEALAHIVEMAIESRDCPSARAAYDELGRDDRSMTWWAPLGGDVAACEGKRDLAAQLYRSAITVAKNAKLKVQLQTRLAEVLLGFVGPCGARNPDLEAEIGGLLSEVSRVVAGDDAQSARAAAAFGRLACANSELGFGALRSTALAFVEGLLAQRRWPEAKELVSAWEAETAVEAAGSTELCRVQFARGRLAMGTGNTDDALERFDWVTTHCTDSDEAIRSLFFAGGLSSGRGKTAEALGKYAELERRAPAHRLADDAHLKQAKLYRMMGSEKHYVELLDGMADLYPTGDMTQEGLFELALLSMERRNWGAAITILERAERLADASGNVRDSERDRLQYYLARVRLELGERELSLSALQKLVVYRPMTYYMLLAHSLLRQHAPELASSALEVGLKLAQNQTPEQTRPIGPELERVIRLLAVGDLEHASQRILLLPENDRAADAFWTMTALYVQAGAMQTALSMVKNRKDDFRVQWPVDQWEGYWKMAYPTPYKSLVQREAARTKVPASLIYAIMREESEFEPTARSSANAYGLMQLIVPTAQAASRGTGYSATAKSLLRPETNIALGSRVLSGLLARFHGQAVLVAAGYNAGPGRPTRWLKERPDLSSDLWVETIEYSETRNYVKRVLSSRAAYQWLYGKEGERKNIEPVAALVLN